MELAIWNSMNKLLRDCISTRHPSLHTQNIQFMVGIYGAACNNLSFSRSVSKPTLTLQ